MTKGRSVADSTLPPWPFRRSDATPPPPSTPLAARQPAPARTPLRRPPTPQPPPPRLLAWVRFALILHGPPPGVSSARARHSPAAVRSPAPSNPGGVRRDRMAPRPPSASSSSSSSGLATFSNVRRSAPRIFSVTAHDVARPEEKQPPPLRPR